MKMTSRIIALAALCVWMPAALVAQPRPKKLDGLWKLEFQGENMPDISAVSTCDLDGCIVQISYERFSSFLGLAPQTSPIVSYGYWKEVGHNKFQVTLEAELPGNRSQRVIGVASVSPDGAELTGSAEAQISSEDGRVLFRSHANVTGHRVQRPSHLTAMR
jgi:hypothetical protein